MTAGLDMLNLSLEWPSKKQAARDESSGGKPGGVGDLEVIIKIIFDKISPKRRIYLKEGSILSLLSFKIVGHLWPKRWNPNVFFFFWPCCMVCGIFNCLTRDWTQGTAMKVLSPNHWRTRAFPNSKCLNLIVKTLPSLVPAYLLLSHLFNPPAFTESLDIPWYMLGTER